MHSYCFTTKQALLLVVQRLCMMQHCYAPRAHHARVQIFHWFSADIHAITRVAFIGVASAVYRCTICDGQAEKFLKRAQCCDAYESQVRPSCVGACATLDRTAPEVQEAETGGQRDGGMRSGAQGPLQRAWILRLRWPPPSRRFEGAARRRPAATVPRLEQLGASETLLWERLQMDSRARDQL